MATCPRCGDEVYEAVDVTEDLWGNQYRYVVEVCPTCGYEPPGKGGG